MKKITRYIPLQLALLLVIGTLLGKNIDLPTNTLFLLLGFLLALLLGVYLISRTHYRPQGLFTWISGLSMLLIGWINFNLHNPIYQQKHYMHRVQKTNQLLFQITKKQKENTYYYKYDARVLQIDSFACSGKILIHIAKDSTQHFRIQPGDVYYCKTALQKPAKARNPNTFDYRNYLKNKGILYQINSPYTSLKKINYPRSLNPVILAGQVRENILNKLEKYPFGKEELGIIKALILGQRQSISKALVSSYAEAGAIHILAVSGLHVGILFLLINLLLKPLESVPKGFWIKTILSILLLFGFAFLTGLSGSVVRAVSMFSFIAIGINLKTRANSILYALISSFFFLVLINPNFLWDVGFQMSYAAVLGILLLHSKIENLFPDTGGYIFKKIKQLFSVSLAATLATLPLSLYYFHQFPGLFFISNLVIIPFLGIIMIVGIIVVLLAITVKVPDILVYSYNWVLHLLNNFIRWVASHKEFLFTNISFSFAMLLFAYLIIISGYLWWETKKTKYVPLFLFSIFLLQSGLLYHKYRTQTSDALIVFQKTKQSVIGIKKGENLTLITSDPHVRKAPFIQQYITANHIKNSTDSHEFPNLLSYHSSRIMIVDSLGIYQNLRIHPDIILLRQSPKINMERLLLTQKPKWVIADGSNYKSYVKRWANTCLKKQIPFYDTGTSGGWIYN